MIIILNRYLWPFGHRCDPAFAQVVAEVGGYGKCLIQMLPVQRLVLVHGQLSRSGEHVADLATIELPSCKVVEVELYLIKVHVLLVFFQHVEEVLPNLLAGGLRQVFECKATWIRDLKASSNLLMRLLVKIRIPLKYSRVRRKTDTRLFLFISDIERSSKKTSASSKRSTQFQIFPRCRTVLR